MREIFAIDRFEGDIAVCISDSGENLEVNVSELMGMRPNDVFSACVDGGRLQDVIPMPEERDRRLAEYKAQMRAMARRSKK